MVEVETLFRGHFIEMVRSGKKWEWVRRVNGQHAVVIVPVFQENGQCFTILIKQYREPMQNIVVEFPAGLIGDKEETSSAMRAAQTELLEETGFSVNMSSLVVLASGPASPGLSNEILTYVLAKDVTQVDKGGGVDGEQIEVCRVPLNDIESWINQQEQQGLTIDVKIWAGLLFARRWEHDLRG